MSRKLLWMVRLMTVLLAAACGWPFGAARAAEQTTVRPEPVIQDDADLLTEAEEEALRADMLPLCDYGTPLFWTTVETGDYTSLAERFYHRRLGYGESGVLFVINMRARQLTVFSDGAMYRVITRGEAQTITDNVYRMAGREQYYDCASSAFGQMLNLMRGEEIARPMQLTSNLLLALTLALLALYLYLSHRYEKRPKIGAVKTALPVTAAAAAMFSARTMNTAARMTKQKKTNISSGSGSGGGSHGGGFSGGGGHSSGGGGSHGF
ncbi:MAG: TPM domain-containing protein [Clostridia bacterium]|nr:TPM domain-containing protein [Clostridia bacterium]